ncbi:MAG: hypothetical protein GC154_08835 [bacterium]|nr:hypothetical protein [bacterium]
MVESNSCYWNSVRVADGLVTCMNVRESLLVYTRSIVNLFNKSDFSREYIDLVMGVWLLHFSHAVYAHWISLHDGVNIKTSAKAPLMPLCSTHSAFIDALVHSESFHHNIDQAIRLVRSSACLDIGAFDPRPVDIQLGDKNSDSRVGLEKFKSRKPKLLITSPYVKCSSWQWCWKIFFWRLWALSDDLQYPIHSTVLPDWKWRIKHAMAFGKVESFEDCVKALTSLFLPAVFLEGLTQVRNTIHEWKLPRPSALYSANALHGNPVFSILAADWRERGSKLLYHQHGGSYGMDRIHAVEDFESRVADRFYTFGWRSSKSHVTPLSPPLPDASARKKRQVVLLNCVCFPKYVYRLHFHPMPGTIEIMIRETCAFLENCADHSLILVRPYFDDYGWGMTEKLRNAAPGAKYDEGANVFRRYTESELVVHNYLGTSWLETMAMNIPTVCFYDASVYQFRDEVSSIIDKLESVGIVHRSGLSASRFVNDIRGNIKNWWNGADVQRARIEFTDKYANYSSDWAHEWKKEFKMILDSA